MQVTQFPNTIYVAVKLENDTYLKSVLSGRDERLAASHLVRGLLDRRLHLVEGAICEEGALKEHGPDRSLIPSPPNGVRLYRS